MIQKGIVMSQVAAPAALSPAQRAWVTMRARKAAGLAPLSKSPKSAVKQAAAAPLVLVASKPSAELVLIHEPKPLSQTAVYEFHQGGWGIGSIEADSLDAALAEYHETCKYAGLVLSGVTVWSKGRRLAAI
jgi:hypothetical protein